jgi:hypothetical protein
MEKQILLALYASLWEAKPLLSSIHSVQDLFDFLDQQLIPTFDNNEAFDSFQEDQAQAALYLSVRLDK